MSQTLSPDLAQNKFLEALQTSPEVRSKALGLLREELSKRKLETYKPYRKQIEFHKYGATKRERLLRAGNQQGKSLAGAAEAAMHATGRYPDGWEGRRWDKATVGWCAGVTGEVTRDTIQRLLIGPVGSVGTGFIPHGDIIEIISARGVADLADTILVRHVSGGTSRIRLKYYEQGREKFQAETIDWGWADEEPDSDLYTEFLSRTNATGGMLWMTFTPLLGMSEVVRRFIMEQSPDRSDTNMTIDDAEHIPLAERKKIIDSYPAHEREARISGRPVLGSGRIFPIAEESIRCPRFDIPNWYMKIGGLDFGWDHPTAGAELAFNPDMDIVYLTKVYRVREATPLIHAGSLRAWGKELVWAWPHDGLQHDKGSGEQLADIYRREGLNMLPFKATFEDGSNGVEAGLMEMLDRMQTGRFKVFEELEPFFEEFRLYHRKEGKVVKEFDDILSAVRYALMMLRFSTRLASPDGRRAQHTIAYDPLGRDTVRGDYASGQGQHQSEYRYDPRN